jgi:hypothetical protein
VGTEKYKLDWEIWTLEHLNIWREPWNVY